MEWEKGGKQEENIKIKNIFICFLCLAVLVIIHQSPPEGLSPAGFKMLGIAVIAAALWSTEVVPLPVTGIVIVFLKIVLDIAPVSESLRYLAHPVNALLFVGFCLAAGLRKYRLDRKISIGILNYAGTSVKRLLFFVMCGVAFLSMWMSNTATTAVMIPIVASILEMSEKTYKNLGKIFMIGIAYAGTIGGMATPVGTTPNPITIAFLNELVDIHLDFLDWVTIGLPFVVVLIPLAWLILVKMFPPEVKNIPLKKQESNSLSREEKAGEKKVVFYFALLIVAWLSGSFLPVPAGWLYIVSIGGSLLMFLPGIGVLNWEDTKENVNWGVMILIGGGLALGGGLVQTGAIDWIIGFFAHGAKELPMFLVILSVAAITSLGILVFCSITATSTTFIPIAITLAVQIGANPVIFAAAAGIASSFAYMLPANTPPNAIAYGSGYFETKDMLKAGIVLWIGSLITFVLISGTLWPILF